MTESKNPYLTPEQMAEYYPLLTVVFDVASAVLQQTAMSEVDKQQIKLELDTFYKNVMKHAPSFSDNYDELNENEQEAECRAVGSFVYFASVMRMFAERVAKNPTIKDDVIHFDDGASDYIQ